MPPKDEVMVRDILQATGNDTRYNKAHAKYKALAQAIRIENLKRKRSAPSKGA